MGTPQEIKAAQLAWIQSSYTGAEVKFDQSRYTLSNMVVQGVPIRVPDGRELVIHFDITPGRKVDVPRSGVSLSSRQGA
jgi:hypothetical protein